MKMKKLVFLIAMIMLCSIGFAGCGGKTSESDSLWDFEALEKQTPETEDAGYTYAGNENIKGIYFEGAEYNGEATKIFAFVGVPETEEPTNGYPAMVLVHGGLGQAYGDWVKLWTDRGYVAIALSVDANMTDSANKASLNERGGPRISITPADMKNPANSWEYISVANIIACHNILRSMDSVDKTNVGITGISWGSYLTCITVGVDTRFKFGIPVYGAGYNHEDVTGELAGVFQMDDESLAIYRERFDPSVYMKHCKIPMFWLAGANDHAFSLACNQKCADLNQGRNTYSWRGKLTHGQQPGDGSGLPEIFVFADEMTKSEKGLLRVSEGEVQSGGISLRVENVGAAKADFYWSSYPLEYWHDAMNVWERESVAIDGDTLRTAVPQTAVFGFVEITDENGNIVSSRLFTF